MSDQNQVCYTFEAAIEMAVQMEDDGFRTYLNAIRILKDRAARKILKDVALDELDHKQQLEKALLLGYVDGHAMDQAVPTMNLDYVLEKKTLGSDADGREVLVFAIHQEKESLEFYRRMAKGCAGAPMAELFERISNDESRHLQELEDLYEQHFLPEN